MSSFSIAALVEPSEEHHPVRSATAAAGEDDALLTRFLNNRDAEAFEALVIRHGPAVLRICRRWLGRGQQADDAFQATFLVLVNRAEAIHQKGNIRPWLQGVARRVAGRLKMQAKQRQQRERSAAESLHIADAPAVLYDDMNDILRNEVARLPEAYRKPILLCYWEGLSSEQAAERLNCPTGTLKWRLSRARDLLRRRLGRAGLLGVVLFLFGRKSASAMASTVVGEASRLGMIEPDLVPASLLRKTVAIAELWRDNPLKGTAACLTPAAVKPVRKARSWLWLWLAILPFLLATSVVSGAIPVMPTVRRIQSEGFRALCSGPLNARVIKREWA